MRQPLRGLRHRPRGARPDRRRAHRLRLAGHLHRVPPPARRDAARLPRERPAHQPASVRRSGRVGALRLQVRQRALGRRLPADRRRRARRQHLHGAVLLRRRRDRPGLLRRAGAAGWASTSAPISRRSRACRCSRTSACEKTVAFLADFVGMLGEMGLSALLREREARGAQGERAALPTPLRQRDRRPHRVSRRARRRRSRRRPRDRRPEPDPGARRRTRPRAHDRPADERVRRRRTSACARTSTSSPARSPPGSPRAPRAARARPRTRTSCSPPTRRATTCGRSRRSTSPRSAARSRPCAARRRASARPTWTCSTR